MIGVVFSIFLNLDIPSWRTKKTYMLPRSSCKTKKPRIKRGITKRSSLTSRVDEASQQLNRVILRNLVQLGIGAVGEEDLDLHTF